MHHTWKAYASKTQFLSGKSGSLKNERRWMTVNLLKLVTELLKNPCQQSYRSQDVRTTGKWQGLDSFNHEDLSNSSNWANSVLFQAGRLIHCTHHTLHSCFFFLCLKESFVTKYHTHRLQTDFARWIWFWLIWEEPGVACVFKMTMKTGQDDLENKSHINALLQYKALYRFPPCKILTIPFQHHLRQHER